LLSMTHTPVAATAMWSTVLVERLLHELLAAATARPASLVLWHVP
jgi:hypothetical protein